MAELEKRVKAAQAKYDEAAEKSDAVDREVKRCDARIKEITGRVGPDIRQCRIIRSDIRCSAGKSQIIRLAG